MTKNTTFSIQIDYYGTADSLTEIVQKEYDRNSERYTLLKWAQKSFSNFKVVPPSSGICHQVNLEHLGRVMIVEDENGKPTAYPDTLVGTDSHTTMINGIGVMGWGVGGIEAEAVMPGQPLHVDSRSCRFSNERRAQRGRRCNRTRFDHH